MAVQKGSEVFDAASSSIRMEILKLLNAKGPLPYTEIMATVKLDPVRDAGKFVYHLKSLLGAGLISLNEEAKKYNVTELGRMMVNFARNIEEYIAAKKGKMFVRTSRFSIEEFNREKIVNSLVNEASVPYELAQEVAAEVEERLIKLGTKYLTAPLIREFVNSVLIERKLEEYRHKLTRLGMPVYDVTQLFNFASEKKLDISFVKERAGESVIREYVLLNVLPREVADAHLSGSIHLTRLGDWILAPNEVRHDIRFFLKRGFNSKPPKNLKEALTLLRKVFYFFSNEVAEEQYFDMFNIFLAPYLSSVSKEEAKEALYQFLEELNGLTFFSLPVNRFSLGLEFSIPKFLEDLEAVSLNGQVTGVYKDYAQEADLLLDLLMDAAFELSLTQPLINPLLIFKVRKRDLQGDSLKLLKCHKLASESSISYIAFLNDDPANYSSKGVRLTSDLNNFWETSCLRTGNAGTVFLNMPRIAYESKGSDDQFKDLLIKALNLAAEALKVKKDCLNSALNKGLLPLLSKPSGSSFYYEKENAAYTISFIGLNEAAIAHIGAGINADEEAFKFTINVLKIMNNEAAVLSRKLDLRLLTAQMPSDEASIRLAKLDAEKYGRSTVIVQGSLENPYYTDGSILPASLKIPLENRVKIEGKIQSILEGGSLPIHLEAKNFDAKNLLKLTKLAQDKGVKFMFYTSDYSYCSVCSKIFPSLLYKCLKCDTSELIQIAKTENIFAPLNLWPEAKKKDLKNIFYYALN
ncbi:helix-turn-helix domain-containing protein [Candidatus Bathyarchaeota archaeon]|nr:helix-turn-helix domain-containing protein [Candidatus Bathyarchaeota archaeon]